MNIPSDLLPNWLNWAALLIFSVAVFWSAGGAAWRLLRQNLLEWVYAGSCALMGLLWLARAEAQAGLELHFLGIMTLVLIFGWRLALVGAAATLLALTATGLYDWGALGVNGLLGVVVPVLVAHASQWFIYHSFPRHYFVYLIITAHFGAMLVIASVLISVGLLLMITGVYSWDRIGGDYLIFLPMAMLSEGFINGAIMTLLTILRPEWVRSFDDRDYIDGK